MAEDLGVRDRYAIVPLRGNHDRDSFTCGVVALDRYLKRQARQDARRRFATVFVAEEVDGRALHGFYTLSMGSVLLEHLPDNLVKKMPHYPHAPAVRLGRLAVHTAARGQGLGEHLLMDSMARSLASEIAWAAFVVDAKNDQARSFCLNYGFQALKDDPNHLLMTRGTIEQLFAGR